MSKYYKAEDVISKIVNTPTRVITDDLTALADRQHEIIDMLADLPTIDIVHCKDCKHYVSDGGAIMECEIYEVPTEDNHYCGYGERKDNE